MKRYLAGIWAGLAASALLLGNVSPAEARDRVVFSLFTPPKIPITWALFRPWIEDLNAALEDKVVIKVPAKPLAPAPRQMDVVTQGLADGGFVLNGFILRRVPHVSYSFLPQMSVSSEADGVAMWRTYKKFFEPKQAFKDVKVLSFFSGPASYLYSVRKAPIRTLDDFRGLKIWTPPGPQAALLSQLGAAVVPGPGVRVYHIVSKHTVDAFAGLPLTDAQGFNVAQFIGSVTDIPRSLFQPTFTVFFSKEKWKKFPSDVREVFADLSGEAFARRGRAWDDFENKAIAEHRSKSGKPWVSPDAGLMARIVEIAGKMQQAWVKQMNGLGIDGQAALDFHMATAKAVFEERN